METTEFSFARWRGPLKTTCNIKQGDDVSSLDSLLEKLFFSVTYKFKMDFKAFFLS